jgi:hypothetical protein
MRQRGTGTIFRVLPGPRHSYFIPVQITAIANWQGWKTGTDEGSSCTNPGYV